eukprot:scaffold243354_cov20-Prasinocladus_malaysianus.AAC.1
MKTLVAARKENLSTATSTCSLARSDTFGFSEPGCPFLEFICRKAICLGSDTTDLTKKDRNGNTHLSHLIFGDRPGANWFSTTKEHDYDPGGWGIETWPLQKTQTRALPLG